MRALILTLLCLGALPAHAGNERTQRTRLTVAQYRYRQALANHQWQLMMRQAARNQRRLQEANRAYQQWYRSHQTWAIDGGGLWVRNHPSADWRRHGWSVGLPFGQNRRDQPIRVGR